MFDLIEQERISGIPMTVIHQNLCREAGYESAYSTFLNARVVAKKTLSAHDELPQVRVVNPMNAAKAIPKTEGKTEQNRSFVWTGNKDGLTLEDIYKKKGA